MSLTALSNLVSAKQAVYNEKVKSLNQQNQRLKETEEYAILLSRVRGEFEALLDKSRKGIQDKISSVVTTALREIWGGEPEFSINFIIRRNQPEAEFELIFPDHGGSLDESVGGGIEDIIGTVLRVVFFHVMNIQGSLFLDEPGKWLDSRRSVLFSQFLKKLSQEFGIQLIIVTHKEAITERADRVFNIELDADGKSNISARE